ncbi:nucleotide exchange factor GrpE [Viridibacillus sp. YIM B01967]|uniref:Protein GrpE n=1 Tax=Viridibacillus soli TaxID=2798301 RepID=A0ABS1H1T0_9BACL|nr:nucleotide exchange factor GrpE [Viridibacillus soli]MBK3493339.1 nucleotide exchange factor GrpE [Viridibacillus soli]
MSETNEFKEQVVEENTVVEEQQNVQEESTVEAEVTPELSLEEQQRVELSALELKLDEEESRYLRLRADYDNLKRRTQTERVAQEKYRAQNLLTDLLPVLDNFERALQVEAKTEDAESMKKGIEMVYRSLIEATSKEGLEPVATEGETFDPNVHHAVMQEQDDLKEVGIVLQELQKGYKLKDRVLRPAMVKVNE